MRNITFLTVGCPFYVIFAAFFVYSPPSQVTYLLNIAIEIHNIAMGGILFDDIMSERSKI